MKIIKYIIYVVAALILIIVLSEFIARLPSYTIQTNGKLYVFNKKSEDVTVFDLYKGKEITTIPIDIETHQATKILGQDKIAVANYNISKNKGKNIIIINTKSNTIEKTIKFVEGNLGLDGIFTIQKPNRVGAINVKKNTLLVINIASEIVEKKIPLLQKGSHFVVRHPNKPIAYVTNTISGTISVVNLETNKVSKIIPCGLGTNGIAITPDGSEIWATNTDQNTIGVINTLNNQLTNTLKTGTEPINLKFSNDGKFCLIANTRAGTISVFNRHTKKRIKTVNMHGKKTVVERALYHTPRPVNIIMHPNGLYAFIANSNANKIEVLDMRTFTIVSTIGTGKVPDAIVFVN